MKLIGIAGKKRAGKDTAALALLENGWAQVHFADPLKAMLKVLLRQAGLEYHQLDRFIEGDQKDTPLGALCGRSPRHAMQTLGTEWGRQLMDDNLWISIALAKAATVGAAVISDVRFPNEAQAIKRAGGHVIKIVRSEQPQSIGETHPSEVIDFPVDNIIINNTTIKALQQAVLETVSNYE